MASASVVYLISSVYRRQREKGQETKKVARLKGVQSWTIAENLKHPVMYAGNERNMIKRLRRDGTLPAARPAVPVP